MALTNLRQPRLLTFAAAWLLALLGIGLVMIMGSFDGLVDANAYWSTGHGMLYRADYALWNGGYSYSPAFAQLIAPLVAVPWALIRDAWLVAAVAAYAWLLAPLRWMIRLPLLVGAVIFASDNLYWALALVAVIGFRYPSAWALPLLTKVTPGVGVAWFAVRGEWRSLAVALGTTAAIVLASIVVAPDLWSGWIALMAAQDINATSVTNFYVSLPPLPARTIAALFLVAWGGRTDRRWTVPVAMIVAQPDISFTTFGLLAALPRLRIESKRFAWPQLHPRSLAAG